MDQVLYVCIHHGSRSKQFCADGSKSMTKENEVGSFTLVLIDR